MFINIKINLKTIIAILGIIFIVFFAFFAYKFISENRYNKNDKLIIMDSENYTNILKEIHDFPDTYIGNPIETSGFVFRADNFSDDEFVVARNMIVCCESDSIVVGFLCKYNNCTDFPDNTWVTVQGNIELYEKDGTPIPIIKANKVSKSKTPNNINVSPPTI